MPDTNPTIKIYANYSPNTNGEHIIYDTFEHYTTFLNNYLLDTISVDNYRINQGRIEVKLSAAITLANYKNATYIVHSLDNMCYTVRSATYQSGYIIYDVEVDYWGTYIGVADIQEIRLLKASSNAGISSVYGVGIYPDCDLTGPERKVRLDAPITIQYDSTYPGFVKLMDVFIIFSIQYVVENVNFGNGAIVANGLYAVSVDYLMSAFLGENPNNPKLAQNAIEVATGIISGIYGIKTGGWADVRNCNAQVTNIYILTRDLLPSGTLKVTGAEPKLKSKSPYGEFTELACSSLYRGMNTKYFNIIPDADENANIYFGTIDNGLKVRRTTLEALDLYIKTEITSNKIAVVCGQGDNQKDITNSFSLPFSTNNGDVTELGGIKSVLSTAISGAGFLGSLLVGNPIGAVGSGLSFGSNVANLVTKNVGPGQPVTSGDAFSCFYGERPAAASGYNYPYSVMYPIGYKIFESLRNDENNNVHFGIDYDCYIPKSWLFGGLSTTTPYYILATVNIGNIPKKASDVITSKFANGIYLRLATTTNNT